MTERTPRLVNGLTSSVTWNVKASVRRSQNTPSERWIGMMSRWRSRLRRSEAWSSTANARVTSELLEAILWRRRLAAASMALVLSNRSMAPSLLDMDFRPSST